MCVKKVGVSDYGWSDIGCVRVGEVSKMPYKGVEQNRGKGKQRFLKRGKLDQEVLS